MAAVDHSITFAQDSAERPSVNQRPADSLRFDLISALLGMAFVLGLYLDGWAHNNGFVDESFFTPWHAVLYGAYAVGAAVLVFTQFRNVQKGYGFLNAVPRGYALSLLGVLLFAVGGVGDMLWHTAFGIEEDLEALYSPTHLLLATAGMLIATGPLRAAWQRREKSFGWGAALPMLIAALAAYSILTFFIQIFHSLGNPSIMTGRGSGGYAGFLEDVYGMTSMIISGGLLAGMLLLLLRRWSRLPAGSMTLLLGANALLMFWMRPESSTATAAYAAQIAAGLVIDGLLLWLRPSPARPRALRTVAFVATFVLVLTNLAALGLLHGGLWWQIHMWLGAPFVAGAVGFMMSFLVVAPTFPEETAASSH